MIHCGVKLWSSNDLSLFHQAADLYTRGVISFVEVYTTPHKTDLSKLTPLSARNMPVTVHAAHGAHGFNLAQNSPVNFALLRQARQYATASAADKIVIHLGFGGNCRTVAQNLRHIQDSRVLLENMPEFGTRELGATNYCGTTPQQVDRLMDNKFGLCLDFGHAIKASIVQKRKYQEVIAEFMQLKPTYFHVTDGAVDNPYDEHLNLGEGGYDLPFIKHQIETLDTAWVVFETPKTGTTLENDQANIEYFRRL